MAAARRTTRVRLPDGQTIRCAVRFHRRYPWRQEADDPLRVAERLNAGASACLLCGSVGAVDVDMAFAPMRLVGTGTAVAAPIAAYAAVCGAHFRVRVRRQNEDATRNPGP